MIVQVYILKNCDTCRKAIKWLETNELLFDAHDIRQEGINVDLAREAITQLGWQTFLNKRSTTWRNLDESERDNIDDAKAVDLVVQNTTLMKRPLFVMDGRFLVGFTKQVQDELLRPPSSY